MIAEVQPIETLFPKRLGFAASLAPEPPPPPWLVVGARVAIRRTALEADNDQGHWPPVVVRTNTEATVTAVSRNGLVYAHDAHQVPHIVWREDCASLN